jgi:hypothetical protein
MKYFTSSVKMKAYSTVFSGPKGALGFSQVKSIHKALWTKKAHRKTTTQQKSGDYIHACFFLQSFINLCGLIPHRQ